ITLSENIQSCRPGFNSLDLQFWPAGLALVFGWAVIPVPALAIWRGWQRVLFWLLLPILFDVRNAKAALVRARWKKRMVSSDSFTTAMSVGCHGDARRDIGIHQTISMPDYLNYLLWIFPLVGAFMLTAGFAYRRHLKAKVESCLRTYGTV